MRLGKLASLALGLLLAFSTAPAWAQTGGRGLRGFVKDDSGAVLPVCAWVDGEYGISGVYLGVEAEIGAGGVRRIVERDLTDTELAALREAAEAVRAKQADVADM